LGALELFLGLRELLRFGGDLGTHCARQIVEAREQDDDNQEAE
jgi:methyl coenzyme M reductase gamma subunit